MAAKSKGGFQRKLDKLTARIYLLQELVQKLETRIRIQDEIIQKLRAQRKTAWRKS